MKSEIQKLTAPVILSERDYRWLEKLMKKNDKRKKLHGIEKQVIKESKEFTKNLTNWLNGPADAPIIYPVSKRKKNS